MKKRPETRRVRVLPAELEERVRGQAPEVRALVVDAFRAGTARGEAQHGGRLLDYLERRIGEHEARFGALSPAEVTALAATFEGEAPDPRVFAHFSGAAGELIQLVVWLGGEA